MTSNVYEETDVSDDQAPTQTTAMTSNVYEEIDVSDDQAPTQTTAMTSTKFDPGDVYAVPIKHKKDSITVENDLYVGQQHRANNNIDVHAVNNRSHSEENQIEEGTDDDTTIIENNVYVGQQHRAITNVYAMPVNNQSPSEEHQQWSG